MVPNQITGPDPDRLFPCDKYDHIVFLKNAITSPYIEVGEYTYYSDLVNKPEDFQKNNVLYLDDCFKDMLHIGRYCAIASGAKFLMNASNHKLSAFTTYPFRIFSAPGWGDGERTRADIHFKGDIVVENDVWIGYDATILPGAKICDGAIIGAKAVVTGTVPPYAIAAGNPARIIRMRFDDETIALLLRIQWWNWSPEKIAEHIDILSNCDRDALRTLV